MQTNSPHSLASEINVTPLVDVMLVLLIIFMVTAPLLDQGIRVALPKAQTGQQMDQSGLNITLTKEHAVYLNRELVTMAELRRKLAEVPRNQPLLIRSDRNAYVSRLIELWDLCRAAGFGEIRIATLAD
ncbi:MAG: biopolymer transporter ExbD [Candidatus Omnitrophica bacterium]|nr:biopolymer transporter ExbD [Candidatus Omnitrophota bacterium]